MITPPDVLVLGGGGVLGEVWMMGVLAGIEDATGFDLRECEYFVGTSAGSIVSAHLAAGDSPRRPGEIEPDDGVDEAGEEPVTGLATSALRAAHRAGAWAVATGAAFAPLALGVAAPGGALVRAQMLRRIPRPHDDLHNLRARIQEYPRYRNNVRRSLLPVVLYPIRRAVMQQRRMMLAQRARLHKRRIFAQQSGKL